jgi:hypothetical protein
MNIDRKLLYLLAVPFAGMLIPLGLWYAVTLKPSLTMQENNLLRFYPPEMTISRLDAATVSGIVCPVSTASLRPTETGTAAPASYPSVPLASLAPIVGKNATRVNQGSSFFLTLVMLNGAKKLAIINDRVLREGEMLNGYRVTRIEKDKVRLNGKRGDLWINVE